jgi:hypothetical protein
MGMEHFFKDKYELGLWELQNDILFHKIPKESHSSLIDLAWENGIIAAKDQILKLHTSDPVVIAEALGINIIHIEDNFGGCDYKIFSEYYSNEKKIVLYKNTIIKELSKSHYTQQLDYIDGCKFFIAHELYHHLECHFIGLTSKKHKITTFEFWPIKLTSGIKALCEIGAHSFTKILMNMEV